MSSNEGCAKSTPNAGPPEKSWLITESDFARLIEYSYAEDNVACIKDIIKEIRSNPAPDCNNCSFKRFAANMRNAAAHDADVATKAQGDVQEKINERKQEAQH